MPSRNHKVNEMLNRNLLRPALPGLLVAATLVLAPAAHCDSEQVTVLNNAFRGAYSHSKEEIRATLGPVIVAAGDKLYLIRGQERLETITISPAYSLLKTVDHVPLAIFVVLHKAAGGPPSEQTRETLLQLKRLSDQAKPAVQMADLPASTKVRLSTMLSDSDGFIDSVLKNGVNQAELNRFVDQMHKPTMENVYDAVAIELGSIDCQVRKWRGLLSDNDWANLHVVVTGGHMPRERERRMQYFSAVLHEKREGDRLIFMEGSDDVEQALDLLATHILDESISRAYFHEKWRMHRDLLSDAASRYLRLHPPLR